MTRIVAVDGLDGSGKSQFAAVLAAACVADGVAATVLHVDDFKRDLDFAGLDADAEASPSSLTGGTPGRRKPPAPNTMIPALTSSEPKRPRRVDRSA